MSDERFDRMEECQQEMLVTLTRTSANLESLCKKFDSFMESGAPRCATHTEKLKTTQKGLKALYGWVSMITMALIYALINHLSGQSQ